MPLPRMEGGRGYWGGEGSGQLRTCLGRAGHVWLRLRAPSACPVVPRLQSSGLSEDLQDVSTDPETPSTGLPSRAGLLPTGGLGLLPSTPTLHGEQGPCIRSLHGRVARSLCRNVLQTTGPRCDHRQPVSLLPQALSCQGHTVNVGLLGNALLT